MKKGKQTYLGDGVYVEQDGWMLKLSTQRAGVEHAIWLENAVLDALMAYLRAIGWEPCDVR